MSDDTIKRRSRTDWVSLAKMDDDNIDTSDIPAIGADFFETAELRMPEGKSAVLLTVDKDLLEWFEQQEDDYPGIITTALREYADAHR